MKMNFLLFLLLLYFNLRKDWYHLIFSGMLKLITTKRIFFCVLLLFSYSFGDWIMSSQHNLLFQQHFLHSICRNVNRYHTVVKKALLSKGHHRSPSYWKRASFIGIFKHLWVSISPNIGNYRQRQYYAKISLH